MTHLATDPLTLTHLAITLVAILSGLVVVGLMLKSVYRGGVTDRDGSYHQGPVWAWLLGHWALAHFRVHGDAAAAQRRLEPIGDHLADAALGQVSEIFDGDPPHTPRGCPVQAWSVACALEAWWRLQKAAARS